MAKIKFGMIVVDGRGKLGGHVLSKNRAGAYARTKVTPVNPQTSYQTGVRSLFGAISQAWSGLTASQIAAWNAAVSDWQKTDIFGDLKNPTGKALFQRLNNQAQIAGYPAVLSVPERLEMVSGQITSSVFALGAGTLSLAHLDDSGAASVVILSSGAVSNGTTFVKNKLRVIATALNDSYVPTDGFAGYASKFGAPAIGQKIFVAIKYVLPNGQASPMQVIQASVVS